MQRSKMCFSVSQRLVVVSLFLVLMWTPFLNAASLFNFYIPISKKEDSKIQTFIKTFESDQNSQFIEVFYKDETFEDLDSLYRLISNPSSDERTSLALVTSDFFVSPDGEHYKGITVLGAFPQEPFQFLVLQDFAEGDLARTITIGYLNTPSASLWAAYQNSNFQFKQFTTLEDGLSALKNKEIEGLVIPKTSSLPDKETAFKIIPGAKTPFRSFYIISSSKITHEQHQMYEKALKNAFSKSENLSFMENLFSSENGLILGSGMELLLNDQKPLMTELLRKTLPEVYARGYTMDVPYESYFISPQTPLPIVYALFLQDYEAPNLNKPFTYLDLGAGQGYTVNILAALYPESEFWGVDLNHEHIENARTFARTHNLSNAHFIEAGFSEIDLSKLPQFDFIILHGVWSWVNVSIRHQALEVIQSRLKPTGIVYVSYNTLPGWSVFQPITTLMGMLASRVPGNSVEKFKKAFEEMFELRDAGASFFEQNPEAFAHLDEMKGINDVLYLAHEYLNKGSFPDYSKDVAASFKGIGLKFGASINILNNFPEISMSPREYEVFKPYKDTPLAETIKDFIWNTVFRWDLFVGDEIARNTSHDSNTFYYGVLENIPYQDTFSIREQSFDFKKGIYHEILLALKNKPLSFQEICEVSPSLSKNKEETFRALHVLLGADRIALFQKRVPNEYLEALTKDRSMLHFKINSSFNRSIIEEASKKTDNFYIASETLGGAPFLTSLDALFLLALENAHEGEEGAWLYKFIKSNNLPLPEGAETIPEKAIPFLKDAFEEFVKYNLKNMVILGIIIPEIKTLP